ncbi:hypothetical protein L1887_30503 [Cichorium endivia]|nr:hypothetical protein L1887_30503 [Cichorium endivia]
MTAYLYVTQSRFTLIFLLYSKTPIKSETICRSQQEWWRLWFDCNNVSNMCGGGGGHEDRVKPEKDTYRVPPPPPSSASLHRLPPALLLSPTRYLILFHHKNRRNRSGDGSSGFENPSVEEIIPTGHRISVQNLQI